MVRTYKIYLNDTKIGEPPIIITVCGLCYDDLSFAPYIESQEIVAENLPYCHNPHCLSGANRVAH